MAVVKHSHHSPDLRGKDSARFVSAGAEFVLFSSRVSFLVFPGEDPDLVRRLPIDVILVEGYSRRRWPGLRFHLRHPGEVAQVVAAIESHVGQPRRVRSVPSPRRARISMAARAVRGPSRGAGRRRADRS